MELLGFYFLLLFGHWLGDFVCQTHWQATNKSKNNFALFSHTLTYSAVLTTVFAIASVMTNMALPYLPFLPYALIFFFLVTFVTHFITDYNTSRLSSSYWQKNRFHSFFVVVGFDQLVHQYTIILTMLWLMGGSF